LQPDRFQGQAGRRSHRLRDQQGHGGGPDPRVHHRQLRRRDGDRPAGDRVGHLRRRPPRRLLVLLPVVLPCPAHGDEGADAGRGLTALRRGNGPVARWRPLQPHRHDAAPAQAAARGVGCALVAVVAWAAAGPLAAAEHRVRPGTPLQPVIDAAAPGDTVRLAAGRHAGPVVLDRPLTLAGDDGAVLAGPGAGSVVTVSAPDVRVHGLEITGSGLDLPAMDAAILVRQSAPRAEIHDNHLVDNLFGVYLHGAAGSIVRDNVITGRQDLRLAEAGNGVSIWNAPGAEVVGNTISHGRDGIFVKVSTRNTFQDNT